AELRDGLCRKIRENGHVDRNLVVEQTDAAADGGATVARGSVDEAHARRDVHGIRRQAVVIEPHAKIEDQTRMNLPAILGKQSEIVASGSGSEQRVAVNNFTTQRRVFAKDIDGQIGKEALISGARQRIAKSKEMAAVNFQRPKMQILRPLVEPRVTALRVEEGAGVLFREKSHLAKSGVGRKNFGVKAFYGEKRGEIAATGKNPAFRGRS